MTILGIETSCDETSSAIVKSKNHEIKLISNIVASSLPLHAKTGGIVPENAAREQIKFIIPVIKESLKNTRISEIDAIAITYGPGLIGSLFVGVETAKILSLIWNKPLIPVNHLIGHIYANWIEHKKIELPAIGLIVSGGHTDLVLIKNHGDIKWLGGTRDDAAGEAFDKIGRLMNLPYPAGSMIEKLAINGNARRFPMPSPMIYSKDFDFSFSGLKAAVLREIQTIKQLNNQTISDICASAQEAIIEVLVKKTITAAKKYKVKSILLGGGVAANQKLRDEMKLEIENCKFKIEFFVPSKNLCTDNAAMIATAAFFNNEEVSWNKLSANPQLYFD